MRVGSCRSDSGVMATAVGGGAVAFAARTSEPFRGSDPDWMAESTVWRTLTASIDTLIRMARSRAQERGDMKVGVDSVCDIRFRRTSFIP